MCHSKFTTSILLRSSASNPDISPYTHSMDTTPDDIHRMDRDEMLELFDVFRADRGKLEKHMADVLKQMIDEIKQIKFVLPVPASKELCLYAAKGVRMAFDEISDRYRLKSEPIKKQLEHILERCSVSKERLNLLISEEKDDRERMLTEFTQSMQERENSETKEVLELFLREQKRQANLLLQENLPELVKEQEGDLKKWFAEKELGDVISHMKIAQSTRPEVVLGPPVSRLPLEIKHLIFSFSSLESCVALREVNKDWYSTFQNSEAVLERKMKERNPWIKPGDPDLQTWADCVLVFAGRLRCGNWSTTDCLEDALYVPYEPWVTKTVVGHELKPDEKLPANFSGMFDQPDEVSVYTSTDDVEYLVDPWTLTSRKACGPHKVIRQSEEEGLVLESDGIKITLDPSISSNDIVEVHVQVKTIYVTLEDYTMAVFQRDKPHYKHALRLDYFSETDFPGPLLEVGDVVVHRLGLGDYEYRFSLVDFDTKTTTFICENANPAASYNGLMWFSVGGFLAPTFVDLKDVGVAYYRSDRALRGIGKMSDFTQASKSRGLGQFTVRDDNRSLFLADLATGVLTQMQAPVGWRNPQFIPGFQDGTFQLRCIKGSDLKIIRSRVFREHGVVEEVGSDEGDSDEDDSDEDDSDDDGWF